MGQGNNNKKLKDDGFVVRTVMAMATEMVDKKRIDDRLWVQFNELAKSVGVKVVLD